MSQSIHLSQPKTDVQAVQSRNGLPTHRPGQRARARFVYVVFPKSWEYVAGFGFLPVMRSLTAKPGANGVPASGSLAKPIASAIQKGGTFIDPKDQRLGEYMDYVQFYDTQTGGKWYVDFCSKVTWNRSANASRDLRLVDRQSRKPRNAIVDPRRFVTAPTEKAR